MESASVAVGSGHAEHDHHGPPEANQSSRIEAQFLGMLLFIISEVMLFGAFFTAYFFIRVVGEADWPAQGEELPKIIAGVNTAILISSSFTMHWALEGAKNENRAALRVGMLTTALLGLTFLCIQINEYVHLGFAPADKPKIAFAVMLEYGGSGGAGAGLIARDLIDLCVERNYLTRDPDAESQDAAPASASEPAELLTPVVGD